MSPENSDKIYISPYCFTAYPCMHYITINNEPNKLISGDEIIKFCTEKKLPIPGHFSYLLPLYPYIQARIDDINRKLTYDGPYPPLRRKYGEMYNLTPLS